MNFHDARLNMYMNFTSKSEVSRVKEDIYLQDFKGWANIFL